MPQAPTLKRGIRFRDLVPFYVATVLSVRWTATAAAAGPSILVVWIGSVSCFFLPLAASVMELSSRYPEEGGIYVWTREAFGDFAGFICAWTYWMCNLPFFASVLYFGAGSALFAFGTRAQVLNANPLYYMTFAAFWLGTITLINIRGVNAGKWLNNICALGVVLPLTALILMAATSFWRFGPAVRYPPASFAPHWSLGNAVFWSSVFFAFAGTESISAMADEIENPRRTIPWALLVAGSILTIGYVGGTAALLVALPSDAVGGPDGFVNGIHVLSERLGVTWLLAPMALLVALNAIGGAAGNLSSAARLPFVAGVDRYLPAAFGWIHARYRTPWVALAVYGGSGVVVALLGQAGTTVRGAYDVLVSMAIISNFLPFLFLFGAIIKVQKRTVGPEVRRVPGGKPVAIGLAGLGLASTLLTIVLSTFPANDDPNKPLAVMKVLGGTVLLVGAGVAVFVVERRRARTR